MDSEALNFAIDDMILVKKMKNFNAEFMIF